MIVRFGEKHNLGTCTELVRQLAYLGVQVFA